MIDVCLDRHGLPHIRLGLAIFRIEGFFLFRELPVLIFQRVHFGELCPAQKLTHSRLCRPVVCQLRLVLGQIFSAIPGRLVAVKHGPRLCVLHHRAHELGGFGKGGLRVPQLPGQLVSPIHRRLGAGCQRRIVHKIVFPEVLQGGGHLFEIVDLGPPFIGRALALAQPLLNVDYEIDPLGRRGLVGDRRGGPFSGNHRPDVLGIVAVTQGGCPEPGGFLLPRHKERDHAAPPALHGVPGPLHEPQERLEVGGLFCQRVTDGKAEPLLCRRGPLTDPLAVVEETPLAVQLWVGNHGQIIFKAYPVRDPPQGAGRSEKIPVFVGAVQRG